MEAASWISPPGKESANVGDSVCYNQAMFKHASWTEKAVPLPKKSAAAGTFFEKNVAQSTQNLWP